MRRSLFLCTLLLIGTIPITMNVIPAQGSSGASWGAPTPQDDSSVRSWPPDTNTYVRSVIPEDYAVSKNPELPSGILVRDVVVSNTDPNLTNTDTFNDGEPTIGINPANTKEIVLTAFSGSSGGNAALWHSIDGGNTWTKRFTVPSAPGVTEFLGCTGDSPCDQAVDYGRNNKVSGTFLDLSLDIHSGTTTTPANSASWNWLVVGGITQRTNSIGAGYSDQPWLLVNRDPTTASQENVYVAYDDFNGSPDMRIAVALGTDPANFVRNNLSGFSTGSVNPGHRLTVDPNNGYVYSLFQRRIARGADGISQEIDFMLNRSTDGGQTWVLNGSPTGIVVATADSTQPYPKFGTVNALLGGVLHAAVDPTNSDVYYVYGSRDEVTGNDKLSINRLTNNGAGGLTIGTPHFVTGQVQAALPSIAVARDGTIGVLYDTFDGMSEGLPQFSAHFATSTDHGISFTDNTLLTFLSAAADNGSPRQRVFGDYQQVKAVNTTFYGAFTANGAPFGRPIANHDPIFFKLNVVCPNITCAANITQSNDPNQCGAVVIYSTAIPNGTACGTITCSPASGSFFPVGTTTVNCTSAAESDCSFTVTVRDTQAPKVMCPGDINVAAAAACPIATSAPVNFTVSASDNCPGVTTVCKNQNGDFVVSGSGFPVGASTVTCTATDASGNTASCSFTINQFSLSLQDENSPGNVVFVNAKTGFYSFFCGGIPVASGSGTLTANCCIGSIDHNKGDRQVHIQWDTSANTNTGIGTALLGENPNKPVCQITDKRMPNNTFCLQDDSSPGNAVLVNARTGDYSFCRGGIPIASGRGTLNARGCLGSIDYIKGDRKVHIEWDTSANNNTGAGAALLQKSASGKVVCQITDKNMSNNTCGCSPS